MKFTNFITILLVAMTVLPAVLAIEVNLLKTDPAPIVAGDYADATFRFGLTNQEGIPQKVILTVKETDFIVPVSENNFEIKGLRPGDVVTRTIQLYFSEKLAEGYIDIQTELNVDGIIVPYDLRVFVQEEDSNPDLYVGSVVTTPNELLPDTDDNEIVLTLQNLGDKDAELVRATLETNNSMIKPAYAYSMIDSVSKIAAGSEEELFFVIDIDENARGYIDANLNLQYRSKQDGGSNYEVFYTKIPFVIPVQDSPFLEIVSIEQLDSFATGSTENRIRVGIKNTGVESAEEVRVRILPDISYPFIFELTTEYVSSEIKPGEIAYVDFKVEVLKDASPKEYFMTARLESLVGDSRYSREDTLSITPKIGSGFNLNSVAVVLVVITIISSIVIGVIIRRNNKQK